jgi:hypothetical protein
MLELRAIYVELRVQRGGRYITLNPLEGEGRCRPSEADILTYETCSNLF